MPPTDVVTSSPAPLPASRRAAPDLAGDDAGRALDPTIARVIGGVREAESGGALFAVPLALNGILVLVGHVAKVDRLIQPLAALPPQSLVGGVNTVLIAIAIGDPAVAGRRIGRAAAWLLLIIASVAFAVGVVNGDLASRAPVSTLGALIGLITGSAVVVLRRPGTRLEGSAFVLACAITLLVGSAALVILTATSWVTGSHAVGTSPARLPLQSLVNALLVGGALLYGVYARPVRGSARVPRWLPVAAGVATVAWSAMMWRTVARAQDAQLQRLVTTKAEAIEAGIRLALAFDSIGTRPDGAALVRRLAPVLPAPGGGIEASIAVVPGDARNPRPVGDAAVPVDGDVFARTITIATLAGPLLLRVWPSDPLRAATRTNLPELIFLLGTLMAGLLAAALKLAGDATRAARNEERGELLLALAASERAYGYEWDVRSGNVLRHSAIARQLGFEPDTLGLSATGWLERIHPDDRGTAAQLVREHLRGQSPEYVARYRVRAANGEYHQLIDRGRVVERDPEGRAVRVAGLCADLDAVPVVTPSPFALGTLAQAMLAPNGHVITSTQAARRFVQQQGGTGSRRAWIAAASDEDAARLAALIERAASDGTVRGDVRLRDGDGEVRDMELALTALRESSGRRGDEVLLELWDVTERRRADAVRAEADRLMTLGRLSARVAHEINNPLAGIRTAFQLVKRGLPEGHAAWPFAEAIEREIQRIAAVTRQLYETYRPDESPATASVTTVVGDAVSLLGQAAIARGVHVRADTSRAPACVDVPEAALRQAVYNLVQNAVEASPAGGTVTVTVADTADGLALAVRDEGPGIPVAVRERVFDEGFTTKRGSPATSGLGIGLALVRHSVVSLGGTISVHDAEGGGAEFRILLPRAARARPAATIA